MVKRPVVIFYDLSGECYSFRLSWITDGVVFGILSVVLHQTLFLCTAVLVSNITWIANPIGFNLSVFLLFWAYVVSLKTTIF